MRWCVSSLPKLQRHSAAFLAHGLFEASKFGSGRKELDGVRAKRTGKTSEDEGPTSDGGENGRC